MTQAPKHEPPMRESIVSRLQSVWNDFMVSQEMREVYLQLFNELSESQVEKLAEYELKSFQSNSSLLFVCIKSIETREQSFGGIRDMDQYLKDIKGWDKNLQIITQCAEVLQAHRMITLSCVENLISWSAEIFHYTGKIKEFRFKQKNYSEKINKDSVFVQYTEMAKFFMFYQENDPLLIALTNSINLMFSSKTSNYFIKANKFSIPIPSSISSQVSEVLKIITSGLDESYLIEKAKNFSTILQNFAEISGKSNEKVKVSLSNTILYRLIDETLEFLLYPFIKSQTTATLSELILFKYLDMSKAVKKIVQESINELKIQKNYEIERITNKSIQEKSKIIKKQQKNSIGKAEFHREDSKNTIKTIASFPVESTRPSVSLNLTEGENPLHKLIITARSIKAKNSQNFNRNLKKTPEILKIPDKTTPQVLKTKFFYDKTEDQSNDSITKINKSLKLKIKTPLNTSPVVKSSKSNFRNQNFDLFKDQEKSSETPMIKSQQVNDIRYISTKSPLKRKIDLIEERKFEKFKAVDFKIQGLSPLNKPFTKLSPIISELSKTKALKQDLNFLVITEGIYRNLVETLIKEEKIQELAERCLKDLIVNSSKVSEQEKKNYLIKVNNWKLQSEVFDSILESFLSQSWLVDLAFLIKNYSGSPGRSRINSVDSELFKSVVIEEPEDFIHEVFTPGIHSPNEVLSRIDSVSEQSDQSSIPNSRESRFAKTKASPSLNLLKSSSKELSHFFSSYLSKLPQIVQKFHLSFEKTLELALTGEDISWLSFNHQASFKGILGFCTLNKEGKKVALVFHVSTYESSLIGSLMKETLTFLKSLKFSSAVFQFSRIPEEVKKAARELELRLNLEEEKVFADFYDVGKDENSNFIVLNIKTTCSANVIIGFQQLNKAMIEFGSHPFLAFHIFSLMNDYIEPDFFNERSQIRLQQDLKDILELLNSETAKKHEIFPYIHSSSELFNKSRLELRFNWPGMSRSCHSTGSKSYLFLNFQQVFYCKTEHFLIYYSKTSDPNIQVAFIVFPHILKELESDMKSLKTDLFWKAENILQSADEKVLLGKELSIPGFSKNIEWEVTWMKGFEINRNCLVSSCVETFSWTNVLPEKFCSSVGNGRKEMVQDQFIVAVIDLKIWQKFQVPLVVALVKQEDWIQFPE